MSETTPDKAKTSWPRMLLFVLEGSGWRFVAGLAAGLVLNSFTSATNPLALKYLFDEGIIRRDFGFFVLLSVGFVLIFTLWRLGVYFYRLYIQRLKNSVFEKLCLRLLRKYFDLPYARIIGSEQGYFLSRVY